MGDFYYQGKMLMIGFESEPKGIGVHWNSMEKIMGKKLEV
jgi:hypothetical protein